MKTSRKWALAALMLTYLLLVLIGLLYDEGRGADADDLHAQIEQAQDKRALAPLILTCLLLVLIGLLYGLLAQKLGFALTTDKLNKEIDAILQNRHSVFYVVTWPLGNTAAMDEENYFFAVGGHYTDSAYYNAHAPRQAYVDALKAAIRVSAANADEAIAIAGEASE